jgi:hypothetical protein
MPSGQRWVPSTSLTPLMRELGGTISEADQVDAYAAVLRRVAMGCVHSILVAHDGGLNSKGSRLWTLKRTKHSPRGFMSCLLTIYLEQAGTTEHPTSRVPRAPPLPDAWHRRSLQDD